MENTLHRIKAFIDNKGLSIRQFEQAIGMSNGAFASQLKNNKTIGVDKLENILQNYPDISPEWLLTGNGAMLKTDKVVPQPIYIGEKADGSYKAIPLVNQVVAAGFGSADFGIKESDVKAYYVIPKFKDRHIDFMIEVAGSSMYPKYNSGDVIACTILRESKFIQWNKVHVIGTTEQGLLVKRIKEGDTNTIMAVSDNPEYPPFPVSKNEITGMALVVGVIRLE